MLSLMGSMPTFASSTLAALTAVFSRVSALHVVCGRLSPLRALPLRKNSLRASGVRCAHFPGRQLLAQADRHIDLAALVGSVFGSSGAATISSGFQMPRSTSARTWRGLASFAPGSSRPRGDQGLRIGAHRRHGSEVHSSAVDRCRAPSHALSVYAPSDFLLLG